MATYLDVFGVVLPALRELVSANPRAFWQRVLPGERAFGGLDGEVTPELALRFATGEASTYDHAIPMAGDQDDPVRVLSLARGPGVLFIDAGGPLPLTRTLIVYAGQTLLGLGPHAEDDHVGTLLECARPLEACVRLDGDRATLAGLRLRATPGGPAAGVSAKGVARARVERCVVEGFEAGIVVASVEAFSVRHTIVSATTTGILLGPHSVRCRLLGTTVRLAGARRNAAVVMDGREHTAFRCRFETDVEDTVEGALAPVSALRVTGAHSIVAGCRFVLRSTAGPAIAVRGTQAAFNVFERNVYSGNADLVAVDRLAPDFSADMPALLRDEGRSTIFRDAARAGFPAVDFSTRSLLANGSFEHWEARRLPGRWFAPPAEMPIAWALVDPGWGIRDELSTVLREGLRDVSRFIGRGELPEGATFLNRSPPPDGRESDWFGVSGDVHHGAASLWLAVIPAAGATAAATVEQVLRVPRVAPEYVFSCYAKTSREGAHVQLLVQDDVGLLGQSEASGGNTEWTLLTCRFRPRPGTGTFQARLRCRLMASGEGAAEAFFDRAMLVAGTTVPHYVEPELADTGGSGIAGLEAHVGRAIDLPLTFPADASPLPAGAPVDVAVVGQPFDLTDDILARFNRDQTRVAGAGGAWLDVRVNGQPLFEGRLLNVFGAEPVARIPLARVRAAHRRLKSGDVVTLHATAGADLRGCSVVLNGHRRTL